MNFTHCRKASEWGKLMAIAIMALGLTTATAQAQVTFSFTYTDSGAGFNDPTEGAARRAALESAASTLAALLPTATPVTVTFSVSSNSESGDTLASAGSDSAGTSVGFSPTVVQQKLTGGVDANGATADGVITWNFRHAWALGDTVTSSQFDFKSTAMHEVLHAMGFSSAISQTGQGLFDLPVGQPNLWNTFDKFIADASGNRLVRDDFTFNSSLISAMSGGSSLYFVGPNAVAANGGRPVVLYSPTTWEEGSSGGSHTDDATYTGSLSLLMNSATTGGLGVRTLSEIEKGILKDLGYNLTNPGDFSYLSNLSVRSGAGTGAQTLIVGFVTRNGGKSLLIRGIGPTLTGFGVSNALADPVLAVLNDGGATIFSNDDWGPAAGAVFASAGAFGLASGSRDAAVTGSVSASGYTAQVSGVGGTTGVALIELYDLVQPTSVSGARLVNLSARTQVGTGADILIAGFAVSGTGSRTLLIRAVGPTLANFGVTGVLANPQLELYSDSTKLNENNNWVESVVAPVAASAGAFALPAGSLDAALVVTLAPGSYTVQVSGVGGGTGVALVEVYDVR